MFGSWKSFWRYVQAGWFTVTAFYVTLLAIAYAAYYYTQRLPNAQLDQPLGSIQVFMSLPGIWQGLSHVWFIFAWGFGIQLLVQVVRVFERKPKEGHLSFLFQRGAWMSAHAGLFEELIFRLYAYLSFVMVLNFLNGLIGGELAKLTVLAQPALNFVTFGLFAHQFSPGNWSAGVAMIIGASFFRSAHIHYGKFSKANVWVIGVVMFWLAFNYGLITAIVAHFLYDLCVFTAIALSSPLQPSAQPDGG